MAEAHNINAFSLALNHDGLVVSYDEELLKQLIHANLHSYKRRYARFKNDFAVGIFPGNFQSLAFTLCILAGLSYLNIDLTFGLTYFLQNYFFGFIFG
uniref:Carnitine O-palmitoyltransferase N-terminal domain-containing protein n=1 Tax=Acrobeloides nanus TaxID=290746 RepID=A0A914EMB0_9BILA